MKTNWRDLPHSDDLERNVLACLLIHPHSTHTIKAILRGSKDFHNPNHALTYEFWVRAHGEYGEDLDVVLFSEFLRRLHSLDSIGGSKYLADLMDWLPSHHGHERYATELRNLAIRRDAHVMMIENLESGHVSHEQPTDDWLDSIERQLFDLRQSSSNHEPQTMGEILEANYEAAENADGNKTEVISTGLVDLDKMLLGGFVPGTMIVLGARPSHGKSALAMQLAAHAVKHDNVPTMLFSLEVSRQMIGWRVAYNEANVSYQNVRNHKLTPEDFSALARSCADWKERPFDVHDQAGVSISQIRSISRRYAAAKGVRLVIVDYLQLVKLGNKSESRQTEVAAMSRELQVMARELNVAVLVCAQLNRAAEGRADSRPRLSDLRESGAIEQDADVVMLLHRDDQAHIHDPNWKATNDAEVIIAKQRDGPTGIVKLNWFPGELRFKSSIIQ